MKLDLLKIGGNNLLENDCGSSCKLFIVKM